ncbi:MAG: hypothetical protein DCF31_07945 [Alphaproteobacteria bacterium]|nr:MAG: hypothetical protein DCF31_07945 [Alphaproteobacteria bacterium]
MFGYYAYLTIDGRLLKRFYSDRRYGSAGQAFEAARSAVDAKLEIHRQYLALKRRHHRRANSPADVPGVNRVPKVKGGDTGHWIARWHDAAGRRRSRKFSVKTLGERGAYEAALRTRLHETMDERSLLCLFRVIMADVSLYRPD